ncbi:MAG: glycine cleavage system protein H [Thermoguttaceae bacterium]
MLTYKLCDRNFQCDSCPLDVGLCGSSSRVRCSGWSRVRSGEPAEFPIDRRYTRGHAWIQPLDAGNPHRWRFGLDAFAAAIMGYCGQLHWHEPQAGFAQGDPLCDIDFGLGCISIGAPLPCKHVEINEELLTHPDRLVAQPYGEGWLAVLDLSDHGDPDELLQADAAREKTHRDLRWFRRQVALRTLAESGDIQAGDMWQVFDFREMMAGPTYLKLLPELVY